MPRLKKQLFFGVFEQSQNVHPKGGPMRASSEPESNSSSRLPVCEDHWAAIKVCVVVGWDGFPKQDHNTLHLPSHTHHHPYKKHFARHTTSAHPRSKHRYICVLLMLFRGRRVSKALIARSGCGKDAEYQNPQTVISLALAEAVAQPPC